MRTKNEVTGPENSTFSSVVLAMQSDSAMSGDSLISAIKTGEVSKSCYVLPRRSNPLPAGNISSKHILEESIENDDINPFPYTTILQQAAEDFLNILAKM